MSEKSANRVRASAVANVPQFGIVTPLRCFHPLPGSEPPICGAPAKWKRPGVDWFTDEYFCDEHRRELDLSIAGDVVFRRVRVQLDVLLAATSSGDPQSRAEAMARVEGAIKAIGGCLDVHGTHSSFGRATVQPGRP